MSSLLLPSRPQEPYVTLTCPYPKCGAAIEYLPPSSATLAALPSSESTYQVTCCACTQRFEPPGAGKSVKEAKAGSGKGKEAARRRRIGTDEKPLDMEYYDILGLPASCTNEDIKRAYRKLAIKLHPDKNPNDPAMAERFKQLATAYSVLSDADLRHKYNEFGGATPGLVPEDGFVDPEEVFGSLFGGPRFADIIGTISIGRDMKEALQQETEELEKQAAGEEGGKGASKPHSAIESGTATPDAAGTSAAKKGALSPEAKAAKEAKEAKERARDEERAKQREERVGKLAETLVRKLSVFTESVRNANDDDLERQVAESFREITRIEAEELKQESYGVELLNTVGFVYTAKAKHYLASTGMLWGIGGLYHSATNSMHVLRETVSTVRAALELKTVFEELAKAETEGITEDRKKELEEEAATKGMKALWKGAKLETESILREVTDRVLADASVSKQTQRLRAQALTIVGEVYSQIEADKADAESEYVKINTKQG